MRVVIDTNVFISAALKERSVPTEAVHLAATRDLLLKSSSTEQELFITLARPRLAPLMPPGFLDRSQADSRRPSLLRSPNGLLLAVIRRTTNSWSLPSAAMPM